MNPENCSDKMVMNPLGRLGMSQNDLFTHLQLKSTHKIMIKKDKHAL
jgi:hypothetical protein